MWPWNLMDDIEKQYHTSLSFVHHFKPIGEFKLELLPKNAQFGSKLAILSPVWPRNLMDDLEQCKSEGFDSCDRPSNLKFDSNRRFFSPCDIEIWWTTSKNNRALLLYQSIAELKLEVQSGNAQFGSKLAIFCPVWPWNLMDNLGKQ